MNTYYNDEGRLVMRLAISDKFKQSSFIRDVLESGRHFVVDVQTGQLLIEKIASKLTLYYEYQDYISGEVFQKKISRDFPTAIVQLEEMVEKGYIGFFKICINGNEVFKQKLVDFVSESVINKAYTKYVF